MTAGRSGIRFCKSFWPLLGHAIHANMYHRPEVSCRQTHQTALAQAQQVRELASSMRHAGVTNFCWIWKAALADIHMHMDVSAGF